MSMVGAIAGTVRAPAAATSTTGSVRRPAGRVSVTGFVGQRTAQRLGATARPASGVGLSLRRDGGQGVRGVYLSQTSSRRSTTTCVAVGGAKASTAAKTAAVPRESVRIAVFTEVAPAGMMGAETRVCATPDTVRVLAKGGATVVVQSGAGTLSGYSDAAYEEAGATVAGSAAAAGAGAQVVFAVNVSTVEANLESVESGATVISLVNPAKNQGVVDKCVERGVNLVALDLLPRMLSRAQAFDVLSSQANVAGYRAVVEAQHLFGRFLMAQTTAAGSQKPAKVLVIGAGVAGLAAIQQAKAQGAVVRAFDVRQTCEEQVKAVGGEFLKVPGFENEDGAGAGGYAKEVSPEFIAAEMALFKKQCEECDVVITTALIPNRPAPKLILAEAVAGMKPGSVLIDLAAENGGNVEGCVPGETVTTANGAIICGKYPLQNDMPAQASSLFASNVTKFYTSMGDKESFFLDPEDDAVRGAWLVSAAEGELERYIPAPPVKPQAPEGEAAEEVKEETPEEVRARITKANVLKAAAGAATWGAAIAVLAAAGTALDVGMLTTFALACLAGGGAVHGVAPALHSPLMSLTNAISGLTIVGGLLLLGQGAGWGAYLAPAAVFASALNIGGGFTMTGRMIGMFSRAGDVSTFPQVYAGAILLLLGGLAYAGPAFAPGALLVASMACLLGIGNLGKVATAPTGNWIGLLGVAGAIGATMVQVTQGASAAAVWQSAALFGGLGIGLGALVGAKAEVTDLPQLVALFHSFVGFAATSSAIGDFLLHGAEGLLPSVYAAALIGSLTVSGSLVAFAKLQGLMKGGSLKFPGQQPLNALMAAGSVALGAYFVSTAALAPLLAGTALFFVLGYVLAAQVGGGDMPIVITLLNSASGWALAAEGFALSNPLLTVVGSLIGSSGLMLSLEMCDAMGANVFEVLKLKTKPQPAGAAGGDDDWCNIDGTCTENTVADVATKLDNAKRVMIVPGYGLAVAKGQYAMAEIVSILKANGADVKFMIHPVAGRLPGQLNVLLAEAGVDYDDVVEMDDANEDSDWADVDVVLVAGANDTVNPLAETEPRCELYGMPVVRCWKAKEVVMMKRSLNVGYSGAVNPAVYMDNVTMFLGDAKCNLVDLAEEIRKLKGAQCILPE